MVIELVCFSQMPCFSRHMPPLHLSEITGQLERALSSPSDGHLSGLDHGPKGPLGIGQLPPQPLFNLPILFNVSIAILLNKLRNVYFDRFVLEN